MGNSIAHHDNASIEWEAVLGRYGALMDDLPAAIAAAQRPLPVGFWVNPLKAPAVPETLAAPRALGVDCTPIPWMPGAFRSLHWVAPGRTLPFFAGWCYVQEEIAMTAIAALDPQPGDRVLDLCAAPGGKTAQIALRVGDTGCVLANERNPGRMASLTATIARLGLTNVITTQADGRELALLPGSFDRILVDAPCSGEGTLRRRKQPKPWNSTHSQRIAAVQRRLLDRALTLVKPGGVVVYSTCTFAPEENEAVIDAVLGDRGGLESFDLPTLHGQPGQDHWQGQTYRGDLRHAQRYWPHLNDTGGFFVARIRRANTQIPNSPPAPSIADPLAMPWTLTSPLQELSRRFGLPVSQLAANSLCWTTGQRRQWLTSAHCIPPATLAPQTLGIPLATQTPRGLKPTTAFLQRFGPHIQQNRVMLDTLTQVETFLQGRSQALASTAIATEGYVHVGYGPYHLGCGWYQHNRLQSQIPKTLQWVKPQKS